MQVYKNAIFVLSLWEQIEYEAFLRPDFPFYGYLELWTDELGQG